jgi:hypothetical protein
MNITYRHPYTITYTYPYTTYQQLFLKLPTTRLKLAATNQQPIRTQKLAANKKFNQSTESTDTLYGGKLHVMN